MRELPPPNLQRTSDALDAFDEAYRRFDVEGTTEALRHLEESEKAVGAAFAVDTADRNDFATASTMRPCEQLRAWVCDYKIREYKKVKAQ